MIPSHRPTIRSRLLSRDSGGGGRRRRGPPAAVPTGAAARLLTAGDADALREMGERSPVPTAVELDGELTALPEELQATVWFVCSEALANVARHARARRATVRVVTNAHAVVLEVRDDGRAGARLERGLRGLADRVSAFGGQLDLVSPPGGPTLLRATVPRKTGHAVRA